jgi:hypothetical protein
MDEPRIRELFAVIDAARWDDLAAFFVGEVVFERPGYEPIVGLDALLRFYREERIIVTGKHFVEQVVTSTAAGACWGRIECVLRDGSRAEERFADTYLFDGGRISHRRSHFFRPAV